MLTRLDCTNGKFDDLKRKWQAQCEEFGESFAEYAVPALTHAAEIAAESPPDGKYGIYAFEADGNYECLMHVNCARLPRTTGKTIRILWVLLAPRFDFADVSAIDVARVAANILLGGVQIANDMTAEHVKLHLGNFADRKYMTTIASALGAGRIFKAIEIRGNWLHISL
jgi:hypothetical protein